jgi:hypothetical protein
MAEIPIPIPVKQIALKELSVKRALGSPDVVLVGKAKAPEKAGLDKINELAKVKHENLTATLAANAKPESISDKLDEVHDIIDTRRNADFVKVKTTDADLLKIRKDADYQAKALNDDFAKNGYDGMQDSLDANGANVSKTDKQKLFQNRVIAELKTQDKYKKLLTSPAEEKRIAEEILRDPRYRADLAKNLQDAASNAEAALKQNNPDTLMKTLSDTETTEKIAMAQMSYINEQLVANDAQIKEFQDPNGSTQDTIRRLSATQKEDERIVREKRAENTKNLDRRRDLESIQKGKNQLTNDQKTELDKINGEIQKFNEVNDRVMQFKDLKDEQAALLQSRIELTDKIGAAKLKVDEAKLAHQKAIEDKAYADKKFKQTAEKYPKTMEDLAGKTALEYVDSRSAEWEDAYNAAWPEMLEHITQVAGQKEAEFAQMMHESLFDKEVGPGIFDLGERIRTRWERETDKSVGRRYRYNLLHRPQPAPEMVAKTRQMEDDFNNFLKDPDSVLLTMEFRDGKKFTDFKEPEQNMLRRSLAREIIDMRENRMKIPLKDYERRKMLTSPKHKEWIDSTIVNNTQRLTEIHDELATDGVSSQDIQDLQDPKKRPGVIGRIKNALGAKKNLFVTLLLLTSGGLPLVTGANDRH